VVPNSLCVLQGLRKMIMLLGNNGFEAMVDRVAAIDKTLGIFDLAQFTPNG
jgi:hypothetical protein